MFLGTCLKVELKSFIRFGKDLVGLNHEDPWIYFADDIIRQDPQCQDQTFSDVFHYETRNS